MARRRRWLTVFDLLDDAFDAPHLRSTGARRRERLFEAAVRAFGEALIHTFGAESAIGMQMAFRWAKPENAEYARGVVALVTTTRPRGIHHLMGLEAFFVVLYDALHKHQIEMEEDDEAGALRADVATFYRQRRSKKPSKDALEVLQRVMPRRGC